MIPKAITLSVLSKETIRLKLGENFPFQKPRAEQEAAFDSLSEWLEQVFQNKFIPEFFGCSAPTGVGKSLIAITAASAIVELLDSHHEALEIKKPTFFQKGDRVTAPFQVWIVTQNKLLQDQYNRDFKELVFDLRGLDNYRCYFDDTSCGQSKCARLKAPENVKKWKAPQYCSRSCEYDEAKALSREKPILLLNVAKALTMLKDPSYANPKAMIFDEGHGVEAALDNEASMVLDADTLGRIDYRFEQYFPDLKNMDMEAIQDAMSKLRDSAASDLSFEASLSPATRDSKKYKRLESLSQKINGVMESMAEGIEYVSCSADKLDLRPLKVHALFEKTFSFPTLFLSATLLSQKGFCSMTGIPEGGLGWLDLDSPFPLENRPIYYFWRMGARPLNFQNQAQEMGNLILRVKEVLDKHPNERGIIHTHTYKIAMEIMNKLGPQYWRRLTFPKNAAEQRMALENHAKVENSVLISPSMTEGVDLKEDLCRFSVMCKVPYLPTNDPVVAARMEANPDWYSYRTAMTLVQAPGRGVRSATDHASTYLLDPGFQTFVSRARHHFPRWFLDSIAKGYRGSH